MNTFVQIEEFVWNFLWKPHTNVIKKKNNIWYNPSSVSALWSLCNKHPSTMDKSLWLCYRPAQRTDLFTVWTHAQINQFSHWGLMTEKCQVGRCVSVFASLWELCFYISNCIGAVYLSFKQHKSFGTCFSLVCVRNCGHESQGRLKLWVNIVGTYQRNMGNLVAALFLVFENILMSPHNPASRGPSSDI